MDDLIQNLEVRMQQLIEQCEQLKEINIQLRQNHAQLVRENEVLRATHKNTLSQITNLVSHLKSIEISYE